MTEREAANATGNDLVKKLTALNMKRFAVQCDGTASEEESINEEIASHLPVILSHLSAAPTPPAGREEETRKLRDALESLLCICDHARTFVGSRQKMHPTGQKLFEQKIEYARQTLGDEQ